MKRMEWIKEWTVANYREIVIVIVFFLATTTGFALGYLYAEQQVTPIVIEKCD